LVIIWNIVQSCSLLKLRKLVLQLVIMAPFPHTAFPKLLLWLLLEISQEIFAFLVFQSSVDIGGLVYLGIVISAWGFLLPIIDFVFLAL
jgi:hypothetical protein